MILSFEMKGIDFEFQITHVSIEYPLIEFEFEDVQALHHFESIIKDFNFNGDGVAESIKTEYEKTTISFPVEFINRLKLEVEE